MGNGPCWAQAARSLGRCDGGLARGVLGTMGRNAGGTSTGAATPNLARYPTIRICALTTQDARSLVRHGFPLASAIRMQSSYAGETKQADSKSRASEDRE
jgi:hypothetical protein